jgi:hypothetical protein
VGADIQFRLDEVFVHAGARGGCSARDMKQMVGRARNVVDTAIHVLLPPPSPTGARPPMPPGESAEARMLRRLRFDKRLRNRYALQVAAGERFEDGPDGRVIWSPDGILHMLACQLAEQRADFAAAFWTQAARSGWMEVEAPAAEAEAEAEAEDGTAALEVRELQRVAARVDGGCSRSCGSWTTRRCATG